VTALTTVRVGTRESRLALAQTAIATRALNGLAGFGPVEVVPVTTHGDTISARQPRGRWVATDGQFTRELERALLDRRVDLVVHSFKDLPTAPVKGLVIGAVLERADARDCLLTATGGGLDDLPFGAHIGTSSPRRAAQLAAARPDLIAMPIRGNVETRLRRLEAGEYDGLLLAAAGLDRLGIEIPEAARLPFDLVLPAPAQGALALQVRADDSALREAVSSLVHVPTRIAVEAERALLRRLGGGCLAPLGALGEVGDGVLRLRAAYEDASGAFVRATGEGPADEPAVLIERVAADLTEALAAR
jgi:hydroxymethylbilane synthase